MGKAPAYTVPSVPLRAPSQGNSRWRTLAIFCLAAAASFALLQLHTISGSFERPSEQAPAALSPADEWQDNVWPFRQPAPWDISTGFPAPRKISYEVTEGTWLRLDVHPKSGEIVFDMLGDIYCLAPPSTTAHPVLLGIPYDGDPRFSPEGDKLAFKSDAELGLDNLWTIPWTSCEEMSLRPQRASGALLDALATQEADEALLASGVRETTDRKARRLLREGRSQAYRVSNETFRFIGEPRWHPDGKRVVATKRYTGSRSLGAGEIWEYEVPSSPKKIGVGAGKRVIGRTLPPGWTAENYNEQQVGPEQAIWAGDDSIIYSKNVIDTDGAFQYSKNVHSGIYAIFQHNLTTGSTKTLVSNSPGGASRPELSRDGKTLAFVRRVRDKEALVLIDLLSGTQTQIWHGLTYDLSTIYAPMGTYPSFAWTPEDDAIVVWAAGKIWHVPVSVNSIGERVAGDTPQVIPFAAKVEKRIAETLRPETDIKSIDTASEQRLYAFTELDSDEDGDAVVFHAAGVTYVQQLTGKKQAAKVPVLHPEASYYSPSFVPHRYDLVIHARWHDTAFTTFEIANLHNGKAVELTGLPLGRYYAPTLCDCKGDRRRIAFVRVGETIATGDIVATGGTGLYLGEIELPSSFDSSSSKVEIKNVRLVDADVRRGPLKLRFAHSGSQLLVQRGGRAYTIDLTASNSFGEFAQTALGSGRMASEVALSDSHFAFVERMQVYLAYTENIGSDGAWAKPGNATKDVARLSLDGGHALAFSRNGRRLFWFLGPYLHSVEVKKLNECAKAVRSDKETFGIDCVKRLLEVHEVNISYKTANLGDDAGTLVITNATLVTMEHGDEEKDVVHRGAIIVRGGVIQAVGREKDLDIPEDATVIDAQGGVVTPGFLDIHAHWDGYGSQPFPIPARDWQHLTALAYGITTLHNPSFQNVEGYVERALVESGRMLAPRIYHTGNVIYGGAIPDFHQEIVDMDEARAALIRIKAEGGPASFSYKNYQLPSRAARQRLLLTAKNLSMICVPEGGMNYDWDLTYVLDGMTTVEHAVPVPQLFDDVLTLYALSGTANTPTHIVNYGGAWGQEFLWANHDVPNDNKLRKFVPHGMLETLAESTARPWHSYALYNTSASMADLISRGGLANVGAHGQPPIGLMYHAEMGFFEFGGLTPYEVLRAATRMGAQSIGVFDSVGSLSAGKLADFIVYPPEANVLGVLSKSPQIKYVARGGRVWEAATMTEFWPTKGKILDMPPINAD